jgi:hypothetical protein
LDEIKYNIGNMKDEFKPHILGMCETFLNEEKCKMNSRELGLDNFTYNRKDRTNKNGVILSRSISQFLVEMLIPRHIAVRRSIYKTQKRT